MQPSPQTIALASDHAAVGLKAELAAWLTDQGHDVTDLGPDNAESVDYPDYGFRLAQHIAEGKAAFGVALCGSGIGISIAVNRNPACRCALVSDHLSASLSRQHNNANVIAMGARLIGVDTAKDCLATFIATPFEGGRHERRVAMLAAPIFSTPDC